MKSTQPVRLMCRYAFVLAVVALASAAARAAELTPDAAQNQKSAAPPQKIRFNRDIRPIMSDTCFHCHGPDKNARKAELRLDIRADALKAAESGEIPIVPGKPDESEIIKRILSDKKDEVMPPPDLHKDFTPEQKALFKRWVAEGAEYEAHWAYTPLTPPAVPKVAEPTSSYAAAAPLDAFILAALADKNIKPSAEADRRTLLRRLSLDLTGLPPTPDEMQAFLDDNSANAYEKQVDRLLASPRYGERMAVWWLDVARFADTVGFHGDQNQRIFPYRDYVIDAFNKNISFAQFTIDQLAGDLLPNPTTEQLIATGFNRLNMMTREGGAQAKEYLAKYMAERVRTVGGAWLGATLGCCECHDHKFDPFKARDFYSMQAFFADMKQWGLYSTYVYTPVPELTGFGNEHPFPPEIEVESAYLKRRIERLHRQMDEIAKAAAAKLDTEFAAKAAFAAWLAESQKFLAANPTGWATPKPQLASAAATPPKPKANDKAKPADKPKVAAKAKPADKGKPEEKPKAAATPKPADVAAAKPKPDDKPKADDKPKTDDKKPDDKPPAEPKPEIVQIKDDGRIIFAAGPATKSTITLAPAPGWINSIRIELLPDATHKDSILRGGKEGGDKIKISAVLTPKSGKQAALAFRHSDANLKDPTYKNGGEVLSILPEWKTSSKEWNKPHVGVLLLDKPVRIESGDTLSVTLDNNAAGCVRVSVSPFIPASLHHAESLAELKPLFDKAKSSDPPSKLPAAILTAWLTGTRANDAALTEYDKLYKEVMDCHEGTAWTMVTQPIPKPIDIRILPRGNWMDTTGPIVPPATPGFLPNSVKPDEGHRLTRIDLAHWLCSPENPLTARAVMNRLWKQFFGNGLSSVVDDLGAQGEPPSHPELLDWLACAFRDSGWDLKRTLKVIVMSNTYRQSSNLRRELRDIDPNNRLLASQNPRRLDAEFVRDNALSIAGLLNLEMGGPSVKPYQPAGYYANLQFPDRTYMADTDERQWRRGVYMHWQRTFLQPMLANFDAPQRDECTANRVCSNTPQQALTLLNDPSMVEAARVFAARLLKDPNASADAASADKAKLDRAFELALGRPAKDKEQTALAKFLQTQRDYYRANPKDAEKLIRVGQAPTDSTNAAELAAWTTVCRVVLNLHETITRY